MTHLRMFHFVMMAVGRIYELEETWLSMDEMELKLDETDLRLNENKLSLDEC